MMKKITFIILAIALSMNMLAKEFSTTVMSKTGEVWYGAFTGKAFCNTPFDQIKFQPFPADHEKKNLLYDNNGNQAAPLLISNMGRYVWSDEPFAFEFKAGNILITSQFESINAVEAGSTLRDAFVAAMKAHFPPTDKTPDDLMFSMPQYNTWIELNYNQNEKDVLRYGKDIIKNGFPVGVFMIDDQWSKDYGNFDFDPVKFPNPKKMVDEMHAMGFKVMLWVCPFVSPDSREFRSLKDKGALVTKLDGKTPAIIRWWNGYSGCLDFTKPVAREWFVGKMKEMQTLYGIDGFKMDAVDFEFYGPSTGYHQNEQTSTNGPIQAEIYTDIATEFGFNEIRASWKGANKPVAQRLQDKGCSWEELQLLIPDMISAGLIGYHYTCPDMIGGGLLGTFENLDTFDQDLMVRSAQIQALMPMMQFSVAPWRVLDAEHLAICQQAATLHSQFGEYILNAAHEAAKTGEPIVRHMEYAFPHEGFTSCNDQYMLGDKYLVTPMVAKGTSRIVKLPKGKWQDERGKKYKGGRCVEIDVPLNRLPYFTRIK